MSRLNGKIALVTGASRGIGRGIASRLAREGAVVAVHYGNNHQAAEETVREIQQNGGSAFAIALPRLNDGSRIINMSSSVTRIALPNLLGYSVSKGALNTLTYVLAQQLGSRNITVNAILPGIIDTDMNTGTLQDPDGRKFAAGLSTFNRWGQPEDVADIASFLASSDSRWVTGQLIDASGGSHL
ncbi:SDR family oxidoreductase [Paenibacillus solisilvae]|uniref:SDR family oxidoreductase n=1 Tax=Paenibacillus solisilvae TaxID=2486751 RepID=A0ABW0VSC5_9BACL